jgi:hypothetical protein
MAIEKRQRTGALQNHTAEERFLWKALLQWRHGKGWNRDVTPNDDMAGSWNE